MVTRRLTVTPSRPEPAGMWQQAVPSVPRLGAEAASDVLAILDAAYRPAAGPKAWLEVVLAAAAPMLDRGGGVEGYFVDCRDGFESGDRAAIGVESDALWNDWVREIPTQVKRAVHTFAPAGYSATLPPVIDRARKWARTQGVGLMGVNALDASMQGVTLVSHDGRPGQAPPTSLDLMRWAYVGSHLAAGARLLRQTPKSLPEAVLDVDGRVLHADGPARDATARSALRRAAVEMDRARTRRGRDHQRSLERWRALVEGRWTLLDVFEENGRRYVVAQANEADAALPAQLSRRERQVATAASLGHANKVIAYELGLAESTVATVLRRAACKLGVRSRIELIRKMRSEDL